MPCKILQSLVESTSIHSIFVYSSSLNITTDTKKGTLNFVACQKQHNKRI